MFFNSEFNFDDFNNFSDMSNMKEMKNDMTMDNQNCDLDGVCCPQVCECPRERCCTRDIHHCIDDHFANYDELNQAILSRAQLRDVFGVQTLVPRPEDLVFILLFCILLLIGNTIYFFVMIY